MTGTDRVLEFIGFSLGVLSVLIYAQDVQLGAAVGVASSCVIALWGMGIKAYVAAVCNIGFFAAHMWNLNVPGL